MPAPDPVYQASPDQSPDSDFRAGELLHLVPGNLGRMLDARRTPIRIIAVRPQIGSFEIEIRAFEDAGTRWELALDSIRRFQFLPDSARAPAAVLAELERARERFAQTLDIPADLDERQRTLRRVAAAQARLQDLEAPSQAALAEHIRRREGSARLMGQLQAHLNEHGVEEIDQQFTRGFVSNPAAGEVVKAHAIVLAELGLCPFKGQVVRNPAIFEGAGSRELRARHVISRLAFTRALWQRLGCESVVLYRGMATDGALTDAPPCGLLSATFSEEVARAHLQGGASTRTARFQRRRVPVDRLLITFLETRAMNERFREAEAVLLAGPEGAGF